MEVSAVPWADLLDRHAGLRLLVLLGSRARGDARDTSAWDLVPLAAASAVLRRDAAAQGRVLAERETGAFVDFQVEATSYWCDIEPVLREAHADVPRAAMR